MSRAVGTDTLPAEESRGVPSLVAYRSGVCQVGWSAMRTDNGIVSGFMSEWAVPRDAGENGGGHPQVTADFLHTLLVAGDGSVQSTFGTIDSLVLAVPDGWYEPEVGGVWARERLWRAVHDELGMPLSGFVSQSVAAAAFLARAATAHVESARPTTVLVCDVGASTVSAALCELAGPSVRLLDVQIRDIRDGAAMGSAFERDALRAVMAQLAQPVPDHASSRYARLVQSLDDALDRQRSRTRIVLDRARNHERYRQTPVFAVGEPVATAWITAAEVIGCFAPVAEGIAATIAALGERHRALFAEIRTLALAGGFGAFPLARDAALQALGTRRRPPEVSALDPDAIARGALAVSDGLVEVADRQIYAMSLPVHRLVAGRLVGDRVSLVGAGEAAPREITRNGEPFVVEVVGEPQIGVAALHVDVTSAGGQWEPTTVAPDRPVPPGRYRVGLWPARDGLGGLAFRPVDGAPARVYSLSQRTGRSVEGAP
ncbi:MAG: hypothetical protein ACRDTA_30835 [Pseudonocardiaceae bacterium]